MYMLLKLCDVFKCYCVHNGLLYCCVFALVTGVSGQRLELSLRALVRS